MLQVSHLVTLKSIHYVDLFLLMFFLCKMSKFRFPPVLYFLSLALTIWRRLFQKVFCVHTLIVQAKRHISLEAIYGKTIILIDH